MNGIYPDYVGPTVAHRKASLYPDWVGTLIDIFPTVPLMPWFGGVVVLPQNYDVDIVVSRVGGLMRSLRAVADPIVKNIGVITRGEPGAEVDDEEPGV